MTDYKFSFVPSSSKLTETVAGVIKYLNENGEDIPSDLYIKARKHIAVKAGSVAEIGVTYRGVITDSLVTYFEGGSVTGPRNHFRQAAQEAFYDAFLLGWEQTNKPPLDEDAQMWLDRELNAEFAHIDQLFVQIKELRKDSEFDFFSWVTQRADGYIQTMMSIYNAGIMWGRKYQMLTWFFGDAEHCDTCNELNGQRHQARWYISRNYFPGRPGSDMVCGGYRCKCHLENDNGDIISI